VELGGLDAAIVAAYLAGMLLVGAWVSRRVRGFRDFFVAGGRITTPVLICTLVSTYYGLDVTFGASETAYLEGVSAFFVYSAPFYVSYVAMAVLVAPRIRRLGALSLPEAMGRHYGAPARVAAAAASFLYSAPILSVAGLGILAHVFLGWEPWVGTAVGAGLALAYTVMGGLWADAITDTVQFLLMCAGVAVAAVVALTSIGTHAEIGARVGTEALTITGTLGVSEILVYVGIALTPLVEPAFYQRTFAARNVRMVIAALLIGAALWAAYDWLVVYLGLVGRDLVASGRIPADVDASAIILHVAGVLLPVGLLGLFVAGCMASAMSTIDSYTLIAAGNVVYDGWQPLARRPLADRGLLLAVRIASVATLAVSVFLSLRFDRLRDAWIFMSTVLLSTVLVPMIAALFFLRRPRPRAGQASAIVGLLTAMGLFVAFETLGEEVPDEGTRAFRVAMPGGGEPFAFEREEAVLVAVPASLIAFAAGALADRRKERR
jgi:SSS family solute:Na+ symporter